MTNNNNSFEGSSSIFSEKMSEKSNEIKKTKTISLYKLFSFADNTDKILMFLGAIGAFGNGLSLVILPVFFGDLVDSFGQNQSSGVLQQVSKVIYFHKFMLPLDY